MAGTYTLTVTDSNGCIASATVNVEVRPAPVCDITALGPVCPGAGGNKASVPAAGANATYTWTVNGGNITSGHNTREITYTAGNGDQVDIQVTIRAANGCTSTCSTSVDIEFLGEPLMDCSGQSVVSYADAGRCSAKIAMSATAEDACTHTQLTVRYTLSGQPITSPHEFPSGVHTVRASATDPGGNTAYCDFNVEVRPLNELVLDVAVSGILDDPHPGVGGDQLRRCITYELYAPGALDPTQVVNSTAIFEVDGASAGMAKNTRVEVPCGEYSCARVRDRLHTLSRTARGGRLQINAGYAPKIYWVLLEPLIDGNLNDDEWIDILDYASYVVRYNQTYSLPGTPCPIVSPPANYHPDLSGNALVNTEDFTFIRAHYLRRADRGCGRDLRDDESSSPVTELSVADLVELGLGDLTKADLNQDGWLDEQDITSFLQGVRPTTDDQPLQQQPIRAWRQPSSVRQLER